MFLAISHYRPHITYVLPHTQARPLTPLGHRRGSSGCTKKTRPGSAFEGACAPTVPHDCHELRSVLPWPSMFTCGLPGLLLVLRWVLPEEGSQLGLHRLVEVWVCKQAAHRESHWTEC